MNNKLVIIGANDFQNQLIKKAKSLGYETHAFAWEDGAVGKEEADFFYPISIVEKDTILEMCRDIEPCGICSIASDLASITVNYVAENLGLICNSTLDTIACTNKYEMRKKMKEYGIDVPKYIELGSNQDSIIPDDFKYPIIVKPTDRSGSRGITKVERQEDIQAAINRALEQSFENKVIVEEYISGDEYSCECISQNGNHHFLAFTKKHTTGAPDYIETAHEEPSDISLDLQEKIIAKVFEVLDALNIKNGASHTEFKIDENNNFKVIEVGARMGGDCIGSDLVPLSTGYDFMKMVIDVACGKEISFEKIREPKKATIKFIMDESDYTEMKRFSEENPNRIIRISDIKTEYLGNATDSSTRAGYYIYID